MLQKLGMKGRTAKPNYELNYFTQSITQLFLHFIWDNDNSIVIRIGEANTYHGKMCVHKRILGT